MENRTRNKLIMTSIIGGPLSALGIAALSSLGSSQDENHSSIVDAAEETTEISTQYQDPRQVFDARLGQQYESVVYLGHNGGGCTATDLGNGIAISAAHCFSDRLTFETNNRIGGNKQSTSFLVFGCEPALDNTQCQFAANITEVAIPQSFGIAPNLTGTAWDSKEGYDIAFIRYDFNKNLPLPTTRFDFATSINPDERVVQMGYSSDRAGLTGESCDIIETTGVNTGYTFTADCFVVPQDSGSPVFDQEEKIIGIVSAGNIGEADSELRHVEVTPITEAFLAALNDFSSQTLDGETVTLQNGTPATLFYYQPAPIAYEPG